MVKKVRRTTKVDYSLEVEQAERRVVSALAGRRRVVLSIGEWFLLLKEFWLAVTALPRPENR